MHRTGMHSLGWLNRRPLPRETTAPGGACRPLADTSLGAGKRNRLQRRSCAQVCKFQGRRCPSATAQNKTIRLSGCIYRISCCGLRGLQP